MKPTLTINMATMVVFTHFLAATIAAEYTPHYLQNGVDSFTPLTLGVPTEPLSILQGQHMMYTFDAAAGNTEAGSAVPMRVRCTTSHTKTTTRTTETNEASTIPVVEEHLGVHLYSADDSEFFRQGSVRPGVDQDIHLVVYPGYTTMVVELAAQTDILEEDSGVVLFCQATPMTSLAFNTPSEPFDLNRDSYRKMFLLDTMAIHDDIHDHEHTSENDNQMSRLGVTCSVTGNTGTASIMVYELYEDSTFDLVGSSFHSGSEEMFSFGLSLKATMMTVIVSSVTSTDGFLLANLNNQLRCHTSFEILDEQHDGSFEVRDQNSGAVSTMTRSVALQLLIALSLFSAFFIL